MSVTLDNRATERNSHVNFAALFIFLIVSASYACPALANDVALSHANSIDNPAPHDLPPGSLFAAASGEGSGYCVGRRLKPDRLGRDYRPSELLYDSSRGRTDNPELLARFKTRALELIRGEGSDSSDDDHNPHLIFAVEFEFNRGSIRQMAAAILCQQAFKNHETSTCRNRTYHFFRRMEPEALAEILIEDITRLKPVVQLCNY